MAAKMWVMIPKHPDDIISAAKSIGAGKIRLFHDPIPDWVPAADYLAWARRGLIQDDLHGRDAAVCYAKRSVCRYIDALLVNNHLRAYSGRSYTWKIELLSKVGISIPSIVHELIINQRNDIEHNYQAATAFQASRAVELAELLLERSTTVEELPKKALISLGAVIEFRFDDKASEVSEAWLSDGPCLLIDTLADDPRVMVLYPNDDEVGCARLKEFSVDQAVCLAQLMRRGKPDPYSGNGRSMIFEGRGLQSLFSLLGLAPRLADRE